MNETDTTTENKRARRSAREVEYDKKKYVSVRAAARLVGLSHTTMYQWAQRGHASNGALLEVIRDTLTNQLMVSEDSILEMIANRFRPIVADLD